jgi:hypothetical protein
VLEREADPSRTNGAPLIAGNKDAPGSSRPEVAVQDRADTQLAVADGLTPRSMVENRVRHRAADSSDKPSNS